MLVFSGANATATKSLTYCDPSTSSRTETMFAHRSNSIDGLGTRQMLSFPVNKKYFHCFWSITLSIQFHFFDHLCTEVNVSPFQDRLKMASVWNRYCQRKIHCYCIRVKIPFQLSSLISLTVHSIWYLNFFQL